MKWKELLDQLHIDYRLDGKNHIPGACTIRCPICGDKPTNPNSKHGNLLDEGGYKCWRCSGAHPAIVISRAAGISVQQASDLIRKFGGNQVQVRRAEIERATEIKLPGSTKPLPLHTRYLEGRGFNPSDLEFYYNIRYTGMMEKWEGTDWGFRVIIPVLDIDGTLKSFQGRDATGKSALRYLFPPATKTIRDSKQLIYGANLCTRRSRVVVVEGVFDAWRLGPGAVATFGTSVTREQISILSNWEQVVLCFDPEPEAQAHAKEIAVELNAIGRNVVVACEDFGKNADGSAKDIADLSNDDAASLRRQLGPF